ncbi:C-di-GMP-specific phosphodiesterase [Secundilactobacillus odoratitofui DSM 19909 = JCM 15043]|uniref:C-di-GMP-specific phosphodiesterase n=1 Tax=Secundilactobacillus odoratitofui DSM 19909 = JCM 15043 TaxID=1423776 RepID=A0A0R1LV02_9LACO|nr:EAL domain-containing protein [Secundilactobacillus odoratitofui]KRK97411.1 C-di-GMP-specific phosphodiesterase [Secundilactobacillus odoratitofui DSM 19909 = JCM 15043]
MYRYFIQPQLNKFTNSLVGYEMLIRKYDDQHWKLPQNFAAISVDEQVNLLKQTANRLGLKVGSISFNLNRSQFIDDHMAEALIQAQHELYPVKLIIEVTEEESDQLVPEEALVAQAKQYAEKGVQISLDDVGSGFNTYNNIKPLLPYADEIKFAMQNFRRETREGEIVDQLQFWKEVASRYRIRMVVEGTETAEEDELLNKLDISYRQGYFYGKPHLVKLE